MFMKLQLWLPVLAVGAALLSPPATHADTAPSPVQTELRALYKSVQTKVAAGKKTEADLADDLKQFDVLLAKENGAKTDESAEIVYSKAQLYLEILDNLDQGMAVIRQIKTDYPDTKVGKQADRILQSLEQQATAKKIQDGLAPGTVFPDFAEKDLNGQPLSVGKFKGKVVVVDFWATWCGPCRAELPNLIEIYKKHHAEGLEVIGISLDSDREKLDSFLKKQDGMDWPEYFDGEGWSSKLATKYGVEFIPFSVLIGPDGKIIAKNLRGAELGQAVAEALGKK